MTVQLDLRYASYNDCYGCTCIRDERSSGMETNGRRPCRSNHTTIGPFLKNAHIQRIRTLDVRFDLTDGIEDFWNALDGFKLFVFPLPAVERISFRVNYHLGADPLLELLKSLFGWRAFPPTKLRHPTLHPQPDLLRVGWDPGCLRPNGTRPGHAPSVDFQQPISSHCGFPNRARLSRVTPVRLPKLTSLRSMCTSALPGFPGLMDVPAFKTLSSLRIPARETTAGFCFSNTNFLVHAENDDGSQPSYIPHQYRGGI